MVPWRGIKRKFLMSTAEQIGLPSYLKKAFFTGKCIWVKSSPLVVRVDYNVVVVNADTENRRPMFPIEEFKNDRG